MGITAALLIVNILCMIGFLMALWKLRGLDRSFWFITFIGVALCLLLQVIWAVQDNRSEADNFALTTGSDCYLGAKVFYLFALIIRLYDYEKKWSRVGFILLDIAIFAEISIFALWYWVFHSSLEQMDVWIRQGYWRAFTNLSSDLFILFAAVMVVGLRKKLKSSKPSVLFVGSACFLLIGDSLQFHHLSTGHVDVYDHSAILLWIVAILLLCMAAILETISPKRPCPKARKDWSRRSDHVLVMILQYAFILVQLYVSFKLSQSSSISSICSILATLLLIVRQFIVYMENRKLARVLHKSREKYREVVDTISEVIFHIDMAGMIQFINHAWEECTGYTIRASIGSSFLHYVHEDDHAAIRQVLQHLQETTENHREVEFRFYTIQSELRWGRLVLRKKLDELGTIEGYSGTFHDTTVQRKVEFQMSRDLEMARRVQQSVLSLPYADSQLSIHGYYKPSSMLSGDMYCWFRIDEHRYGIMLLDVMGHGVSSSLISMSLRSLLKDLILREKNAEDMMHELNRHMIELFQHQEDELLNHYFTCIYVLIDSEKKTVEYINAGHNAGIWLDTSDYRLLDSTAIPVGLYPDMRFEKQTFTYTAPAVLVMYTDGFLDVIAPDPTEAEEKLHAYLQNKENLNHLDSLKQKVADMLDSCSDNMDDMTVIAVEFK